MDVTVVQGRVKVSRINYVVDTPDFKVIHVEADSKRFEIWGGTNYFPDGTIDEELMLVPVEDSMFLDNEVDTDTKISFPIGNDNRTEWTVSYSSYARYGFEVIMYRTPDMKDKDLDTIWSVFEDPFFDEINNTFVYPDGRIELLVESE